VGDELESLERLRAENLALRAQIEHLEAQLRFLSQHRTLAAGIRGEEIIAKLVAGQLTPHTAGHDVDSNSGKIEVKYANLSAVGPTTKRWQWQKIFGQAGSKDYDHLLLVGQADERFTSAYRDPRSPYVLFLVPYAEIYPLTVSGSPRGIIVNSNPNSARGAAAILFSKYQRLVEEIEQTFNLEPHSNSTIT
jgi:hypothetical protein